MRKFIFAAILISLFANLSAQSTAVKVNPNTNVLQEPTGTNFFSANSAALLSEVGGSFQPLDDGLTSIAGLTTAANKGIYTTALDTYAVYNLSAGGRALGGVAGTANTIPYFSSLNTVSLASITAAGLAILDDADNAAQRTTLGLVIGTDVLAPNGNGSSLTNITASQILNTPAGNISSTTVQGSINELDSEKAGLDLSNTFTASQGIKNSSGDTYLAITGNEASYGTLILAADDGDDVQDTWYLNSEPTPNAFTIGTNATKFTLATNGNLTITGALSATNVSGSTSGTNTGDQTSFTVDYSPFFGDDLSYQMGSNTVREGIRNLDLYKEPILRITNDSYASSITIDADPDGKSKMNAGTVVYRVTLTGDVTFNTPTHPYNGRKLIIELTQDATGGRTVTWGSAFLDPMTNTTVKASPHGANRTRVVQFEYNSTTSKWVLLNTATQFGNISEGYANSSSGTYSSVGGYAGSGSGSFSFYYGYSPTGSVNYGFVAGLSCSAAGNQNLVFGDTCQVNTSGDYNVMLGRKAKTTAHSGVFAYADSTNADYIITVNDTFNIRASNGLRLKPLSSAPSSSAQGTIYVDSTTGHLVVNDGSSDVYYGAWNKIHDPTTGYDGITLNNGVLTFNSITSLSFNDLSSHQALLDVTGPTVTPVTPVTTDTVSFNNLLQDETIYATPAGTLAVLTVTLPDNSASRLGQIERFYTTQALTSLTVSADGSGTILGTAVTSMTANSVIQYQKVSTSGNGTWIKL